MPLAEREFLAYARGRKPADLLLADARVVNVYSARVVRTSVAVAGGVIVGLGDYRARRRVNLRGLYLAPGFIDGHIHIESTTLSPDQFARAALPRGTTAVVADPHEVANVAGARGVRFMLASSRNAPLSIFVMLPSCVPASPLEAAGAALGAEELRGLLGERGVLGVGEMMNYPGVLAGDADMVAKLRLGRGRGAPVDGHCPGLSGRDLQAYAGVGIGSDHESTRAEEAREKLEAGLYVMVREGSVARNLATLARIIRAESVRRFLFVSDDLSPDDLIRSGHMDHIVREAIRLGVPPLWALQMVSLNPAEYFGLHDRGAVAPGKRADLVTFERLNRPYIRDVFVEGEPVAREGRLLRPWAAPKVR
ncbi:MAG: amidohydrolase family protein, partial [Nitrospinota bacterium]